MDFFTSIPTHIDYVGQAKAEKLYRAIITLFSIVGFVWGYIVQQFSQSVYILGAGFILAAILTVPPWPMYRRNPLNWQNPRTHVSNAGTLIRVTASHKQNIIMWKFKELRSSSTSEGFSCLSSTDAGHVFSDDTSVSRGKAAPATRDAAPHDNGTAQSNPALTTIGTF
ncbi:hypothetical protein SFRURICE_011503 [Spodoptera frugiperda]|nr:hypothetical protein SFRURICE_011503 [Spodoptera frugiperda]